MGDDFEGDFATRNQMHRFCHRCSI